MATENLLNLKVHKLLKETYENLENNSQLDNTAIYLIPDEGYVTAGRGQDTSLGEKATAEGYNNMASGSYSHAEGEGNQATNDSAHAEGHSTAAFGKYSHAEGLSTTADGYASHAEGNNTTAVGEGSHAEGFETSAREKYSHAEGELSTTEGTGSHAEGGNTTAKGEYSHAEGSNATAYGESSHAEGTNTNAFGDYSHAEGKSSDNDIGTVTTSSTYDSVLGQWNNKPFSLAFGQGSHVEGKDNIAYGDYSHAEGSASKATAEAAHAEGSYTVACAQTAHAEGFYPVAFGIASHAEGYGTSVLDDELMNTRTTSPTLESALKEHVYDAWTYSAAKDFTAAVGTGAHAEGKNTLAYGDYSHTEGEFSVAEGDGSHAEGFSSCAEGVNSHAEGKNTVACGNASHIEGYSSRVNPYTDVSPEDHYTEIISDWSSAQRTFAATYGVASHTEGKDCLTIGDCSHAEGEHCLAKGKASHTEGYGTKAYGMGAHAEGGYTYEVSGQIIATNIGGIASGHASHAEGVLTDARGTASHAEGAGVQAGIESSITHEGNSGGGYAAHAEGYQTRAFANHSHAEGCNTYVGNDTQAVYGEAAHAEGYKTRAYGKASHAEGYSTEIASISSIATDNAINKTKLDAYREDGHSFTIAVGEGSHVEGCDCVAFNTASHAEGKNCITYGNYSHAEGEQTYTSGTASHAEGGYTKANGAYSHAGGFKTSAEAYQFVIGKYNTSHDGGSTGLNSGDATYGTAFIIGNGANVGTTSNAFRVDYAGQAYGLKSYKTTGADYAEYFEWIDKNSTNEDRRGYFVTIDGEYIKLAEPNDYILGIVSGMPAIIGNSDIDWQGRYITDEFGDLVKESIEFEESVFDEESGEEKTVVKTNIFYKQNPDYDHTKPYIQRADRPEWDAVGMIGVLSVRDDGTCKVNGYCAVAEGGIATAAETGYRVIKRVNDHIVKVIFR